MSLHSLPLFVRMAGRPVILLGDGAAAAAKRRLLERAGARIVGEGEDAALAIVAIDHEADGQAAVTRLRQRGILVNAVDRPDLCDFTLPAIVDRDPVLIAIGTGGASAGLAAALRQLLETLLPARLGMLAEALRHARDALRDRFPDVDRRRRALATAMQPGGAIDPLGPDPDVGAWLRGPAITAPDVSATIRILSADPDELTLREARLLSQADRIVHEAAVPPAILERARADAVRIISPHPLVEPGPGLTVYMEMA